MSYSTQLGSRTNKILYFFIHTDNAYDPDVCASKLDINYESFANHPCLTLTDDGNGLDADGMHRMLR